MPVTYSKYVEREIGLEVAAALKAKHGYFIRDNVLAVLDFVMKGGDRFQSNVDERLSNADWFQVEEMDVSLLTLRNYLTLLPEGSEERIDRLENALLERIQLWGSR